jgi:hypothetical protein
MKKFSEFTQATSLTNNDLLLISQWDGVSAYETKYITANLAESVNKKEFIAMIEQTGVAAPTITVIKDDFGDTYTTAYNGVGSYEISGFNGELLGDEEISVNVNNLPVTYFLRTSAVGTNTIGITTTDNTGTGIDAIIFVNTYIRVTKYL